MSGAIPWEVIVAPRASQKLIRGLGPPVIELAGGTGTTDGTSGMTALVAVKLLAQISQRVIHQRFRPDSPRLGAPVHAAEFVDIQIAAARAAFEGRDAVAHETFAIAGKIHPAPRQLLHNAFEDLKLLLVELHLPIRVVHEKNARRETHLAGERDYFLGFF